MRGRAAELLAVEHGGLLERGAHGGIALGAGVRGDLGDGVVDRGLHGVGERRAAPFEGEVRDARRQRPGEEHAHHDQDDHAAMMRGGCDSERGSRHESWDDAPARMCAMQAEPSTDRVRVRRGAIRAEYDRAAILEVLDAGLIAHVGVVTDDGPIVLPMAYGRDDEWLYVHGSVANAALRAAVGQDICVTVTIVDGIVVGRSPFHNSMNYRGVVVRGAARRVDDPDEHARRPAPRERSRRGDVGHRPAAVGRRGAQDDGRSPSRCVEMSAKIRAGDPVDEPEDLDGPHWGGHVPIRSDLGGTCRRRRPARRRRRPAGDRRAWRVTGVTRRNRVDPWGDLHAVDARGLLTGNRGSLVDDSGAVVRHHRSSTLWITCLTEFRGHRQPLADPHRWTPIFFLDEAVALAAGHRPCAYCRRADYHAYRRRDRRRRPTAVGRRARPAARRRAPAPRARAVQGRRPTAVAGARRVAPRRHGRRSTTSGSRACCVAGMLRRFTFDGWSAATAPPPVVDVLTPPTSVAALSGGYRPLLHPTAGR